jgi:hypothetical protein
MNPDPIRQYARDLLAHYFRRFDGLETLLAAKDPADLERCLEHRAHLGDLDNAIDRRDWEHAILLVPRPCR